MRTRTTMGAALMLALAGAAFCTPFAHAQTGESTGGQTVTREEFEQRLREIDQRYRGELEKRDAAIADLQTELARRPVPDPQRLNQERAEANAAALDDMLAQIDSDVTKPALQRTAISFNPDIAVITDFLATWGDNSANPAWNRFDVREAELDIRAAVHPRADGVLVLAFARDVENPVFPEGEPLEGPETAVHAEEAYLFFHDFGVPNLTAKLGRFHVRFGRQNMLHLHDLPTSDPSLANQAFLAPEALSDAGASFSYLIPNPWDQYFEAVFEVLTGEGAGSESPTLMGDLNVDSPAFNTHLLWNTDICRDWNLELGGSWLTGFADADNNRRTNLLGGDLTLMRTDPSGGFNNVVFQAEVFRGLIDLPDGMRANSWGTYLLAQQQLNKDWYVGARVDWTQNPLEPDLDIWGFSPYVSWYWSEFLRFRLQYQFRDGSGADLLDEHVVMFQVSWVFGAHPPEPYWRVR